MVGWIIAPQAAIDNPGFGDDSEDGHSTCVASKAVGADYAVAKGAKLIVVKMKYNTGDTAVVFDMVRKDIVDRGFQKKAVVNVSWGGYSSGGIIEKNHLRLATSQQHIMNDLDVPIVTSAGNEAEMPGREDIRSVP